MISCFCLDVANPYFTCEEFVWKHPIFPFHCEPHIFILLASRDQESEFTAVITMCVNPVTVVLVSDLSSAVLTTSGLAFLS